MNWRDDGKQLAVITAVFLGFYFLPASTPRLTQAVGEALAMTRDYAREHVLLCLLPAFWIAGALAVSIRREAVLVCLGPRAHPALAYGVASVSGVLLAVCSCTVLPLFAGIYRLGAGLGPATTFLYAGPAINLMAITLTAGVLGFELGAARAVGAVVFSILIGLIMSLLFPARPAAAPAAAAPLLGEGDPPARPLWQSAWHLAALVAVMVFANWGEPRSAAGVVAAVAHVRWALVAVAALALGYGLAAWYGAPWWKVAALGAVVAALGATTGASPGALLVVGMIGLALLLAGEPGELRGWLIETWGFAKQILPLLFGGVLLAGLLLGRPGHEGLIPALWVERALGGSGLGPTLLASVAGALMYFATLTEVPVVQSLIGCGMGKGPALALLLAGPALSLPNMLVIYSVLGAAKTAVYVALVVVMATTSGLLYAALPL